MHEMFMSASLHTLFFITAAAATVLLFLSVYLSEQIDIISSF